MPTATGSPRRNSGDAEDLAPRDEEVVLPGERETGLDEKLPAIRRDDAALLAAKLHATQGEADRIRVAGVVGVNQGLQDARRVFSERLRQRRELVGAGGRFGVVADDLRHAAVSPLGGDAPLAGRFDVNRLVLLSLAVGEELEGEPQGFGRVLAGGRCTRRRRRRTWPSR